MTSRRISSLRQDAPTAHEALKLLLSGKGKASEALTKTLTPAGQQIMQDIYHKQRASLAPAVLSEIDKHRDQLAAASPAGHLRSLQVPVLLLHGADDPIIPPTEMLWLERDIPKQYLVAALISPAIGHVDFGSKINLRERLALVHWMASMIHEARSRRAAKVRFCPPGCGSPRQQRGYSQLPGACGDAGMVTLEDIRQAQQRLRGVAARTPLIAYFPPPIRPGDETKKDSKVAGGQLWLKPESLQPIGSFKLRGAYNKIASALPSKNAGTA